MSGPVACDHLRSLSDLGIWRTDLLTLKAYGLCAAGQRIGPETLATAHRVLDSEVPPRVDGLGDSNGMGFAIVHPGSDGVSIGFYWWAMGSVLCQHVHRASYGAAPMDTITRPVVACVWELAIIQAEQAAWRAHMMQDPPDIDGYMTQRLDAATV
ncbi:MAG: hypothetical protein AAF822_03750 [Pseudomonadota bacterium]